MSPITFKFFGPRGACRRVTYEAAPELSTINELVDGMVEGRRLLTYSDSEGDVVLLKTSRDVLEAVKDARDSGAKSIKVQIRLIRECPRNQSKATTANNNNKNRNNCGGTGRRVNWQRPGGFGCRGLFGQPPHHMNLNLVGFADEVDEIIKHFAPFFGIHPSNDDEAAADPKKEEAKKPAPGSDNHPSKDSESPHAPSHETAKEAEETPKTASESVANTPMDEPARTPPQSPTFEEATVQQTEAVAGAASGFTFVENELEDDETEEAAPNDNEGRNDEPKQDTIDEKLKLLKDMGFELPQNVARNMIRELNGRMDLIVRALVANQK